MDSSANRDEAERCIEIATKALQAHEIDRAEKFLRKAENLYPTKKGKELLEKLLERSKSNLNEEQSTKNGGAGGGGGDGSGTARRRTAAHSQNQQQPQQPIEREYTTEQSDHVKRIRKCKDFYEVLGVTKESTDTDIKKAYKKLALQLHPDKNKAPGAVEAFKSIGNAVTVLTDPEKRKQYDALGIEGYTNRQNGGRSGGGGGGGTFSRYEFDGFSFNRGFESNATAEDIFNMFFGGGEFNQNNVYRRPNRYQRSESRSNEQQQQQTSFGALLNLAPILLLILLSMMSSFFVSDPIYNLQATPKYNIQRQTNNLKVPYFVKDNFHSEYQGSVGRLEASVEEEYIQNLKHTCYRERNYKETMMMKARNFGDRDLYRRSQTITTPSCELLHKIHG